MRELPLRLRDLQPARRLPILRHRGGPPIPQHINLSVHPSPRLLLVELDSECFLCSFLLPVLFFDYLQQLQRRVLPQSRLNVLLFVPGQVLWALPIFDLLIMSL